QDRSHAVIAFEYLDHNQGALIQLFHTGTGDDDISVDGTIKGVKTITRRRLGVAPRKKPHSRGFLIFLMCVVWVAWGFLGFILWMTAQQPVNMEANIEVAIIVIVIMTAFIVGMTLFVGYYLYVTKVPKPLSKIYWDD